MGEALDTHRQAGDVVTRFDWRLRFWRLAARDWYYLYGVRIPLLQSVVRERMS